MGKIQTITTKVCPTSLKEKITAHNFRQVSYDLRPLALVHMSKLVWLLSVEQLVLSLSYNNKYQIFWKNLQQ